MYNCTTFLKLVGIPEGSFTAMEANSPSVIFKCSATELPPCVFSALLTRKQTCHHQSEWNTCLNKPFLISASFFKPQVELCVWKFSFMMNSPRLNPILLVIHILHFLFLPIFLLSFPLSFLFPSQPRNYHCLRKFVAT